MLIAKVVVCLIPELLFKPVKMDDLIDYSESFFNSTHYPSKQKEMTMHKYMIERTIPGAANLSDHDLQSIAQRSCHALDQLGTEIQWVQSYVADDKFYCVYMASNKELIQEHARRGQFPVDLISEIQTIVDPTTAEA